MFQPLNDIQRDKFSKRIVEYASDYKSEKKENNQLLPKWDIFRNSDANISNDQTEDHWWINCINNPNFFILSDIHTFSLEALQLLSTKRQDDFPALDSEFRHGTCLEQGGASNHGRSCLENYFCSVLVLTRAPQPSP